MEVTEEKVFEAIGIEQPDAGETQTGAEPAPTENEGDGTVEAKQPPADNEDGGRREAKAAMTPEQRRDMAGRRRRAEQRQAVDEALRTERERTEAELKELFGTAQMKNTLTGEAITNLEQFKEWRKAMDAGEPQEAFQAGEPTPEQRLEQESERAAVIRQVEELARRDAQAHWQKRAEGFQVKKAQELEEIRKLAPDIHTVEDLVHMETGEAFCRYVRDNGLSFPDAFRLANLERLERQKTQLARQQAMANAKSKEHLTATRAQGVGAPTVPPEELKLFRLMNPVATEAQIQAYYHRYKKK